MERKLEGYSVEYDRGFVGVRVDIVVGLLVLGVDVVTVSAVVPRASDLISVLIWFWVVVEEN